MRIYRENLEREDSHICLLMWVILWVIMLIGLQSRCRRANIGNYTNPGNTQWWHWKREAGGFGRHWEVKNYWYPFLAMDGDTVEAFLLNPMFPSYEKSLAKLFFLSGVSRHREQEVSSAPGSDRAETLLRAGWASGSAFHCGLDGRPMWPSRWIRSLTLPYQKHHHEVFSVLASTFTLYFIPQICITWAKKRAAIYEGILWDSYQTGCGDSLMDE